MCQQCQVDDNWITTTIIIIFIADPTGNMTVTIWNDPVIFPVTGPSVLSAANQNA